MKRNVIIAFGLAILIVLCSQLAIAQKRANSFATLKIKPQKVMIQTFYNGKDISVEAEVPQDIEVVALSCEGPEETLNLMRKGRVYGLWMNVEEILFQKIPAIYFLVTSKKLTELYGKGEIRGIQLGYEGLYSRIEIEKEKEKKKELFDQLIKLKESDRLYLVSEGSLKVTRLNNKINKITTTFYLPPKAPPGEYRINLFARKNSEINLIGNQTLTVEKKGLTAYLSSMAINHGLVYGVVAVIIAIISGLIVGVIFSSKGGH